MVTIGLTTLSSITRNEIVVAEAQGDELRDTENKAILGRVSKQLERDDLRVVRLLRAEAVNIIAQHTFQEFRKVYRPPSLIFSCPHCVIGEAEVKDRISLADFRREGGKLTVLPDLEVRD